MRDALDLVCENLQETPTNNKRTFAEKLMAVWECADDENQRRLAIAYPQIASAIIEWQTLATVNPRRAEKYLNKLLKE